MAAILDDVRLDGGQFRDLMAPGIADGVARVQPVLAMATRLGDQIHGLIRPLGGNQGARMPGMSGLPTGLASTLRAAPAFALTAREPIGGRRLRGRGRILLTQRQLSLQIGDALGLLGNLALALGELPSQALNLLLQALLGVLRAAVALAATRLRRYADRINLYSPLNCYQSRSTDEKGIQRFRLASPDR